MLSVSINFLINRVYRIKLLPAFLISLLILSVLAGFVSQALSAYYEYKKAVDNNMRLSVDSASLFLKIAINDFMVSLDTTSLPQETQLKSFHIVVDSEKLESLNSDLPESGKSRFYKAYLRVGDNGEVLPIKLRYRGDNHFHWMYPQKSLRIKFMQNDLYDMHKAINLVNPPMMYGYVLDSVSYEVARELGVISPDFYPARVFINGEYMGVYAFLSQVDESLLRQHKKMPGSIYSGDVAEVSSEGLSELWQKQANWEKVAARNAEQKNNRSDILYYLNAANDFSGLEFDEFVNSMINKEKFYAFMALDVISGSAHHDYHHNHKLYFDPYLGKFEPIEWDVRYWEAAPDKDESLYPLLEQMKLNPVVEYERDKVAYDLLVDEAFFGGIHRKVEKYNAMVLPDLKADPYRDSMRLFPGLGTFSKRFSIKSYEESIERLHSTLDRRKNILLKIYRDSKGSYHSRSSGAGTNMIFKAEGNSPVTLDFSTFVTGPNARLYRDVNFNGRLDGQDQPLRLDSVETIYPGRKKTDAKRQGVLRIIKGQFSIENAPLYYSYLVVNAQEKAKNMPIAAVNALTGERVTLPYEEFEVKRDESDSIHPWELPGGEVKEQTLRGEVEVKGDLIFGKNEPVKIEPGTRFIMAPGASVFFYGKVTAVGSKVRPIRFVPMDASKPWGSVVLQGQGTSGSRFDYVEVYGGSVATRNLINYTAQLNFHDTSEFEVTNTKVGENYVGDDSMHIAYSSGRVDKSVFYNARSDALDVDISDVVITNSIFVGSGNDALDLMTTSATVEKNLFINAGDKGISVGEWSTGEFSDNLFYRCLIGIEVKDKSIVHAGNTIIVDSQDKAINLYNKNPRYDEGGTFVSDEVIIPGDQLVSADAKSSLQIERVRKEVPELWGYPFVVELSGLKGRADNLDSQMLELSRRYDQ